MSIDAVDGVEKVDLSVDKIPIDKVACQCDYVIQWLDDIYKNQLELQHPAGDIPFDLTLLEMYKDDINTNIHFSIPTN
jgi:hypothetical protein